MSTFLSIGLPPPRIRTDEKKRLVVRSRNFCLLQGTLYHKGGDGIWRRCVRSDEKTRILREATVREDLAKDYLELAEQHSEELAQLLDDFGESQEELLERVIEIRGMQQPTGPTAE